MKNLFLVFISLLTATNFLIAQCKIDYSNYHVVHETNFNNISNLNQLKPFWQFTPRGEFCGWGSEFFDESQVSLIQSGNKKYLRLTAEKLPSTQTVSCQVTGTSYQNRNVEYKSGMLQTYSSHSQWPLVTGFEPYGIFEIRCKIPDEEDAFPAFWLYGPHANGPNGGAFELDIFEGEDGSLVSNNIHNWGSPHTWCWQSLEKLNGALSNSFHTNSVAWTPTEITFFIDGREQRTVDNNAIGINSNGFHELIISLQADKTDDGDGWASSFHMDIEWIKVLRPVNNNYNLPHKSNTEWINTNVHENNLSRPQVSPAHNSITYNPNNQNEAFYIGTDKRIYRATRSGNGTWNIVKINYNYNAPLPQAEVRGDILYHPNHNLIIYRGGDGRLQYFGKWNDNYYHWWIDDDWNDWANISEVSSVSGSVTISPNGDIVYRGVDDKIHIYYYSSGDWKHKMPNYSYGNFPGNSNADFVKGDVQCDKNNNIIYKGFDNRLQLFWYNGGNYSHSHIDNYWNTSSFSVSPANGSIALSDDLGIFYRGVDDKLHRFFWNGTPPNYFTHELIPYSYNNDLVYQNGDKIFGNIRWDEISDRLIYRGYDGRLQCLYKKNTNGFGHFWYDNYWNTDEFSSYDKYSTWINNFRFPSIANSPFGEIFYSRKDGNLSYFNWEDCEYLNPTCNTGITIRSNIEIIDQEPVQFLQDIKLYPNPVTNLITIVFKDTELDKVYKFEVLDSNGRRFRSGEVSPFDNMIDLQNVPNGMYILRITNTSFSKSLKFVKQ